MVIDKQEAAVTEQGCADLISLEHDGLVWYVPGDVKDGLEMILRVSGAIAPVSHKPYMSLGEAIAMLEKKYPDQDWTSCDCEWEVPMKARAEGRQPISLGRMEPQMPQKFEPNVESQQVRQCL